MQSEYQLVTTRCSQTDYTQAEMIMQSTANGTFWDNQSFLGHACAHPLYLSAGMPKKQSSG